MTRALLLAAAVVVVAAGCGGTKSATTTPHYPPEVTRSFMRSCLASPKTTRAYCSCTLQEMSKDISTQDFARIGLSGGQIPPRIRTLITRAAHSCRGKL